MIGKIFASIFIAILLWGLTSSLVAVAVGAKQIECLEIVIKSNPLNNEAFQKASTESNACTEKVNNSWSHKYGESFYPKFTDWAFGWVDGVMGWE